MINVMKDVKTMEREGLIVTLWSTVMLVEIGKFPEKQDKDPTMVPNETKSTPPGFHSCSIYVKAWFL